MRLLFLGDMVGRSGRAIVYDKLPGLIADHAIDFVIVNGENAAGGFGVTEQILTDTLDAGADVMTTGNHVWDQREALVFADRHAGFLRPANYPDGTPGRGMGVYQARNGARVMVSNIMGRVFMAPDLDDPFMAAERQLENVRLGHDFDCVVFDFHAEATSEKVCFAHFVDGRASLVVGTHTHTPTADHMIFDGGTGYMSDVGRHLRPHGALRADRAGAYRAAPRRDRARLVVGASASGSTPQKRNSSSSLNFGSARLQV